MNPTISKSAQEAALIIAGTFKALPIVANGIAPTIQSAISSETALIEKQVTQLMDVVKEKNREVEELTKTLRDVLDWTEGDEEAGLDLSFDADCIAARLAVLREVLSKYPSRQDSSIRSTSPLSEALAELPDLPTDYPRDNEGAQAYADAISQWRFRQCEQAGIRADG